MSITINNTTVSNRLTIIFDADVNGNNSDDGPAFGTGNTESDVLIDGKAYYNIRSHTEVPANVHALQCTNSGGTWSYELEYTNNDPNHLYSSQSDLPSWVSNVVIRCEAQDEYDTAYNNKLAEYQPDSNGNFTDSEISNAVTSAETARTTYLTGNSITY